MEAMSHKLPIIAYNIDGISEILSSKSEGFIIDLGDEKSFARSLKILITDYEMRKRMGLNGLKKQKEFRLDRCYSDHCKIINKIIKERQFN